jgi:predicted lipid-binding transport protein (Tim44 family)
LAITLPEKNIVRFGDRSWYVSLDVHISIAYSLCLRKPPAMSGNIDLLTLIALLVTVFVVIKLRGALGKRTPDEDQARYERQAKAQQAREEAASTRDKVVTVPRRDQEPGENAHQEQEPERTAEERIEINSATLHADARNGLLQIAEQDISFDAEHFASGAKQAYEMIVTAFADGDRELLNNLLSQDVFEGFAGAMDERDERGDKVDQSFVGISKCDVVDADLQSAGDASITLKFLSQLITSTMDSAGEVISGDPQKIQEVTDIWTFSHNVNSGDPNWRLVATQASH